MLTETVVTKEQSDAMVAAEGLEPQEVLLRLFRAYESQVDPDLWPWEDKRWHELVFSLLTAIGEPDVSPETTRNVTRSLAEWRVLDVDILAGLNPAANDGDASHPVFVTITTILQQSGFRPDKALVAATSVCEVASGFQQKYAGKVQKYFRKYGLIMLDELKDDFLFSQLDDIVARNAFAIWLQNTLNLPVPVQSFTTDAAAKKLQIPYCELVEAADAIDINVALLDETLRAFWEDDHEDAEALA